MKSKKFLFIMSLYVTLATALAVREVDDMLENHYTGTIQQQASAMTLNDLVVAVQDTQAGRALAEKGAR